MPRYSYDIKCKELAEHFLKDTCYRGNEEIAVRLAQLIQDTIEDHLAGNDVG